MSDNTEIICKADSYKTRSLSQTASDMSPPFIITQSKSILEQF